MVPEQLIDECTPEEREAVLAAAYYVAFADERFWREKPLLDQIRRELEVPTKVARRLKNKAAKQRPKLAVPESEAARQLAYHYALAVAASDGKLDERECNAAVLLGGCLGISAEDVAAQLEGLARSAEHPRRVIDRSVVAGLLIEWVIAIGGYVFSVLALGLVGGMFGGFIDLALSFLNQQWVGQGRQCGWILGAVVGAIGLPLGWVRPDDKKFSFPAPRKLRKNISDRVSQRRLEKTRRAKSAPDADEFRSVADVVTGGGLIGLVGTILGFVFGMCLMMCWFSLALSPFAPGGWFDAIDFASGARSHDQGGMSASTSHPIAISLAVFPTLILGGLGLVGGTIVSLSRYVHYLRTVPPDTRARHRRQKGEALREKKARWPVLVIGIVFTLFGGSLGVWGTMELIQAAASRNWPQVPGLITESKVESWEDSEGDRSYTPSVTYEYKVSQIRYIGDRISFGNHAGGSSSLAKSLVRRYRPGIEVPVYYDPDRPERSVLEPGQAPVTFLFLGLGGLFLVLGSVIVFFWIERFIANYRRGNEE